MHFQRCTSENKFAATIQYVAHTRGVSRNSWLSKLQRKKFAYTVKWLFLLWFSYFLYRFYLFYSRELVKSVMPLCHQAPRLGLFLEISLVISWNIDGELWKILAFLEFFNDSCPLHEKLSEMSRKFGDMMTVWFGDKPIIMISSLEAAQDVYLKGQHEFESRPDFLSCKFIAYHAKHDFFAYCIL